MLPRLRALLPALLLAGLVVAGEAQGGPELPPLGGDEAVLVTGADGPLIYHLVRGGQELVYETDGPRALQVQVRRRLASLTSFPPPVPLHVLGDGVPFLEMKIGQAADGDATIHDGTGGVPSRPDIATIDVPAGGRRLVFKSPAGAPDLLVRVAERSGGRK